MLLKFFKKRKKSSEKILTQINAIEEIESTEHIQELCSSSRHLTLIEKPFFKNLKPIILEICKNKIQGDIVNVGVFKGGASLYMKALFEENNFYCTWWLFDSFCGFNDSTLTKQKDKKALSFFQENLNFGYSGFPSKKLVESLFKNNNLGHNLNVIEGYIENTLIKQDITNLCFIHIDVDFYNPTYFAIDYLYPKLSVGGWVIIDDYNVDEFNCKEAVDEYRAKHNITEQIVRLGKYQIGWRKN